MRISVLQQGQSMGYSGMDEKKPDLDALKHRSSKTIDKCFELLAEAAADGAELAVTIETVNIITALGDTRFSGAELYGGLDSPVVKRFAEAAKQYGIHIVAGLLLTLDGKTYNCAVLFDDEGEIVGIHKKVHLPAGEELTVSAGDGFEVFHTRLGSIGMLVCWDMQYPEAARELALGGADLIACPTWGWENIYGLARAYENSVTIATAMIVDDIPLVADCDPSCIVDNMGKIVAAAPRCGSCALTVEIDIKKEPEPQYNSDSFYPSHSMRKTRFVQRRPDTYRLINAPLEETPLYERYFGKQA